MKKLSPLFVVIAASLWGIDGVLLRPFLYGLPVPFVVFFESFVVTFMLAPIIYRDRDIILGMKLKDWLYLFGIALMGGAIGTMSITKALFYVNFVNLSVVVLIQKLQPVFALSLAAIFLKEKLPKVFFIWAGTAIVGTYFMTFGFRIPIFDTGDKVVLASLFSLLAAFSFASSTVLSKKLLIKINFELATFLRFAATTFILLIVVLYNQELVTVFTLKQSHVAVFLLIAITTGGPAIFMYYYGLQKISASVATICELAFPLTAIILEYILRGNIMTTVQWIGAAVLIISIINVSNIRRLNK